MNSTAHPILTPAKVAERVRLIAAADGDPELAHSREDDLYWDVLSEIARYSHVDSGVGRFCAQLAAEALKTKDVDFPRWYA